MVTGTVVVLDSPPLVPVTDTLNGATPVAHVTESTAPVKLAVQPTGTVTAEKVTVPENPLIGVTVTVEVPATVASVVIAGAESAKSWTVTGTFTVLTRAGVTLVPVTVTLKGATPVVQVTDRTAPVMLSVQPAGTTPAEKVTVPVNPPDGTTLIVEVPATVARLVIEVGVAVRVKSGPPETWMFTVLDKDPLVPVTVTVKVATGEQFTDTTLPDRVTVHPVGAVEVKANATVPEKPLMLFTVIVDVLVTPATILNEAGLAVKEKSWTVTGTVVVLDTPPLVPVTVTENGETPVAQVTDRTAPVKLAVQAAGTVPATKVTVPVNPLIGVTVTVEVPATVARVVIAGADKEKSWTVTRTVVVLDNAPLVPVTVTENGATPVAHVTERTAPVKLALQPAGTVPAEKLTVPVKPLIGVTVTVEVPATVATVVIAGADNEKS